MRVCPRCRSIYSGKSQFCGIDGVRLVEQREDPLLGQSVGRYTIVERLGQGASGCVYKAMHHELQSEFALKVLFGDLGADETIVARFKREAQTASKLRSPNVVSVVDFGTTPEGLTYLVMEYAHGKTLQRVIKADAPLNPLRAARIVHQVASGLASAHQMGFIHRDVKPANIILTMEQGRELAKVLDFGIVRHEDEGEEATKLTQAGLVIGTPAYMSPEQAKSAKVTAAADIYSLGVVLFEMLAGRKPFIASTVPELMVKHTHHEPPPLQPASGLEELAMWMLRKNPEDRPETAVVVCAEAEKVQMMLSGSTTRAGMGDEGSQALPPSERSYPPEAELQTSSNGRTSNSQEAMPYQTLSAEKSQSTVLGARQPGGLIFGFIIGAVLAVVIGGFAKMALDGNDARPEPIKHAIKNSNKPRIETLEAELQKSLNSKGLSFADLIAVEGSQPLLTKWAEVKNKAAAEPRREALGALIKLAKSAKITKAVVQAKLDRMDQTLASIADKLPESKKKKLETRYLELYKIVRVTETSAGFSTILMSVHAFEKELMGAKAAIGQ